MSHYSVITVSSDIVTGEHTNLGIIVWDDEWLLAGTKILGSFERAKARGDLRGDLTPEEVEQWAATFRDKAAIDRWFASTGGAMSSLNLTEPAGSIVSPERTLTELFLRLVRGTSDTLPPRRSAEIKPAIVDG